MTLYDRVIYRLARILEQRLGATALAQRVGDGVFERTHRMRQPLLPHVSIGRHTYGVESDTVVHPTPAAPCRIGSFCCVAEGVRIFCQADHRLDLPSMYPFRSLLTRRYQRCDPSNHNHDAFTKGGVEIGHDVWLGFRAVVLSGSTVGTGAVIGAGSVVAGHIPPYAVVVGNPGRIIRKRFPDPLVERLLASRWWDLPDDGIRSLDRELYSGDLEQFLAQVAAAWERCAQAPGPQLGSSRLAQ